MHRLVPRCRAFFVAVLATTVIVSGCLLGSPSAQDASSSWHQPGAYDALEGGSERGGYTVRFHPAAPGFSVHATPWEGVTRSLIDVHWPVGPYGERSHEDVSFRMEFIEGDRARVARYIGVGDDTEAMRPLFTEFLTNVTDASQGEIDAWFFAYIRDGRYDVEVRGPFQVGAIYDTFDPQPGEAGLEQWDDWEFVFSLEHKSATRSTGDVTHTFHVSVDDRVNYVRTGPSNLSDAELRPLLFDEFRKLGLGEAKAEDLRFEHIHGD